MAQTALQKQNAKERKAQAEAVRDAEIAVRSEAIAAAFEARCKDPNDSLFDDPVWNRWHPLHKAVDALINAGLLAVDAVEEARNGTAPQVEDEEENDLDELAEWLAKQTWSEFAVSLAKQYAQRGSLSPKQEAAAISMRNKVEAGRKSKAEARAAASSDIDLSTLRSGYYAVPGGETRLKVRVARPTKASSWHGWTFVSDGAEYGSRKTYGKQGPEASARYEGAIQDELRAILANPFEAQKAYGKLWGVCGSCGRMLEDADSIAAGIGPICAMKW